MSIMGTKTCMLVLLVAIFFLANKVQHADAVMCYMCGTPAVPNCHTTPGAVIGCPGGAMCWTLYDSAEKATVRARGCSMSTKATCQYGPHGVYRCYCGDKHLCNAATPNMMSARTAAMVGLTSTAFVMAMSRFLTV